jgi:hypothetical protein
VFVGFGVLVEVGVKVGPAVAVGATVGGTAVGRAGAEVTGALRLQAVKSSSEVNAMKTIDRTV